MIQCFDNESSYNIESSQYSPCDDFDKAEDNAKQNEIAYPSSKCTIVKQFFIHGNFITPDKFPFHLYLKQRYDKLSFKELIRIFRYYFNCQLKFEEQIQLESSHIQILNEGLNLFTKVPSNPMLFLQIDSFNQNTQIFTLKNYNGEIVHFQIINKNKKRITTLIEIKRRLKGKPYIIINDKSEHNSQIINQKGLQKLSKNMKFLYIKTFHQLSQFQKIKYQFFEQKEGQEFNIFGNIRKICIGVDEDKNQMFAYSNDLDESISHSELFLKKQQYLAHFQALNKQQSQLIQKYDRSTSSTTTYVQTSKIKLRIFDSMYINFLKETGKGMQQFIQNIEKMQIKYARTNLSVVNQEKDHYTERMPKSRRCKHCQIVGEEGQNMKPKFKCMACSKKYQEDIPLCIRCWGQFHQEVLPIVKNAKVKDMKKVYKNHLKSKSKIYLNEVSSSNQEVENVEISSSLSLINEQERMIQNQLSHNQLKQQIRNSEKSSQCSKNLVETYSKNRELESAIIQLNNNMMQIDRLMDQLEQESPQNFDIVKKFNQVLFVHIVESFDYLMKKCHQRKSESNHLDIKTKENGVQPFLNSKKQVIGS